MNSFEKIKYYIFPCVFGTVWGVFEMVFGSYLHMVNFPLRGALMAGSGCIFMSVLRLYVDRAGVNILAALFAASVKLFSYGGFKLGPVVGILIEGVIIELSYTFLGLNRFGMFISFFLSVFEGIPHFFITNFLMYGSSIFDTYIKAALSISKLFGISSRIYIYLFGLWVFFHFVIAIFSFAICLSIIKRIKSEIY